MLNHSGKVVNCRVFGVEECGLDEFGLGHSQGADEEEEAGISYVEGDEDDEGDDWRGGVKEANEAGNGYLFVVPKEVVVEPIRGYPEFLVHFVEGVGTEGV